MNRSRQLAISASAASAIAVSAIVAAGGSASASPAKALACHASVDLRRSESDCDAASSRTGRASRCCASGLMVAGTGTTRVTCTVPSEAIMLVSFCGPLTLSFCCADFAAQKNKPAAARSIVAPVVLRLWWQMECILWVITEVIEVRSKPNILCLTSSSFMQAVPKGIHSLCGQRVWHSSKLLWQ